MNTLQASYILPAQRLSSDTLVTTSVRLYDATTTSQVHSLPVEWYGHYVEIAAEGGSVDYVVSTDSAQTVDRSLTGTSTGNATSTLGARLADGDRVNAVLPKPAASGVVYLARQGSVSTAALRITLATP